MSRRGPSSHAFVSGGWRRPVRKTSHVPDCHGHHRLKAKLRNAWWDKRTGKADQTAKGRGSHAWPTLTRASGIGLAKMSAMRIRMLGVCLCLFAAGMLPADIDWANAVVRPGVRGMWRPVGAEGSIGAPWRAQWIWMREDVASDMMLARRSFDLASAPESARLRISATSQYELHVNGEYVCRGPARCRPHHQSFDILDISGLLRQGKKHNRGPGSRPASAVFLRIDRFARACSPNLTLSVGGEARTLATDSSWKVHPDLSWDNPVAANESLPPRSMRPG